MNGYEWLETLDRVGFAAVRWLLAGLWQSSILFAAVGLIVWALRKRRAHVRHAILVGALVAAPLLPLVSSGVSRSGAPQRSVNVLPSYSVREWDAAPAVRATRADTSYEIRATPPAPTAASTDIEPAEEMVLAEEVHVSPLDYPWAMAFVGYSVGFLLFVGWMVLGKLRIRKWMKDAMPVLDKRVMSRFAEAKEYLRVRRKVPVLESEDVPVPMTTGFSRPVVLLPRGIAAASDHDLRAIAIHETAHVKRRDPLVLGLVSLVRAAFFFHPLVWLAARRVSALAEEAADDAVLEATGEPVEYAKMLARFAEGLPRTAMSTEVAAGLILSRSAFLRRIRMILSERRGRMRRLSRMALAATVAAAIGSIVLAAAVPLREKETTAATEGTLGETEERAGDEVGWSIWKVLEGESASVAEAKEIPEGAARVFGRAVDTEGRPIANAPAMALTGASTELRQATRVNTWTDKGGRFDMILPFAGVRYSVGVHKMGYSGGGANVLVDSEQELTLVLRPWSEVAPVYGGVVTDEETGARVPGARVHQAGEVGLRRSVLTNEEGKFEIPYSRESVIFATANGRISPIKYMRQRDTYMELVLGEPARLQGVVTDEASDEGLVGSEVVVWPRYMQGFSLRTTTGGEGSFELTGLPPGDYLFSAAGDRHYKPPIASFMREAPGVQLDAGRSTSLRIGLLPMATVKGRVLEPDGTPATDAVVGIRAFLNESPRGKMSYPELGGPTWHTTRTDAQGAFELLTAGPYGKRSIYAFSPSGGAGKSVVESVREGGTREVEPIQLSGTARINGKVLESSGEGLKGIVVTLSGRLEPYDITDADGRFDLGLVPLPEAAGKDKYFVRFVAPRPHDGGLNVSPRDGVRFPAKIPEPGTKFFHHKAVAAEPAHGEVVTLDVVLDRAELITFTGRVMDHSGDALPKANVILFAGNASNDTWRIELHFEERMTGEVTNLSDNPLCRTITDEDGRWTMCVVRETAEGLKPISLGRVADASRLSLGVEGPDGESMLIHDIVLDNDETEKQIDVTLGAEGGSEGGGGGEPGMKYSPEEVAALHKVETGVDLPLNELAKVYAKKVIDLAQTAPDPVLLADVVERALAFDQDDVTEAQLYVYLGDAHWRQKQSYRSEHLVRQRRAAAEAYLTGLRNILRHDLPAEPPERLTYLDGYVLDGAPGMTGKYPTKEQRETASGTTVRRNEKLIQHRQALTGQVVEMYAREPYAFEELRALVIEYLGSEEAAEQVIDAVKNPREDWRAPYPVLVAPRLSEGARTDDSAYVARFMKLYDAEGGSVEAGFVPDQVSVVLGEPLFITFMVINRSEKTYRFWVGGDNRGSVRHNNFRIAAADANGEAVVDPYSYRHYGGYGDIVSLDAGQTYMERLYLGHWCAFTRPGVYAVTCERTLTDYGPAPRHADLPIKTNFKLEITEFEQDEMGEVIDDLGSKVRDGDGQALYEASVGLAAIADERVIPHLALSLTKGDYRNQRPAIDGLSQFSSDAAVDALVIALKAPDDTVRRAAGEAFREMNKGDRAVEELFKELAQELPSVRALAARGLGATGGRRALNPLIEAMDDPERTVRHAAAMGLGELGYKEAIPALKQRLTDDDMAMRVAAVKGLLELGEALEVEWLTPVIRATSGVNDQSFGEAIRLIRLYGRENAARALVSCLDFDDPSPRNARNMFLILGIEACPEGPKYYYKLHHDPNSDGTAQQIANNREILAALKTWLEEQESWGEAVEGVQCRLRAEKKVWKAGEVPEFKADVRNQGEREWSVFRSQEACELELDGEWYDWSGATHMMSSVLRPGEEYVDIFVTPTERWHRKSDGAALQVSPGVHSVRVAFTMHGGGERGQRARVVSNRVWFEIVSAEGGDVAEEGWGEEVEGVRCRLRADKAVWAYGEIPTLKLEARQGDERITFGWGEAILELEFDGKWYWISIDDHDVHRVVLDEHWHRSDGGASGDLVLSPGKHSVRAKVTGGYQGRPVRVVSNVVEIEVLAGEEKSRREEIEGVEMRFPKDVRVRVGDVEFMYAGGDVVSVYDVSEGEGSEKLLMHIKMRKPMQVNRVKGYEVQVLERTEEDARAKVREIGALEKYGFGIYFGLKTGDVIGLPEGEIHVAEVVQDRERDEGHVVIESVTNEGQARFSLGPVTKKDLGYCTLWIRHGITPRGSALEVMEGGKGVVGEYNSGR